MLNVIEDTRNEFKIGLTDKQDNALKFQFETSNIKYSYATVHPDNLASLKSLDNIGYKKYKEKLMYGGKIRYIMRKELV